MINDTTAGRWLKRVIWLGILANLALALPTLAAPDMMMEFVRLPTATPVLWPRFAALLLIILSVFYAPAATDLDRYRIVAWLAIGSRAAGVLFFLPQADLPPVRLLRSRVPRSGTAAAPGRHQQRQRLAGREARGRRGPDGAGAASCAGSPSRCSSSAAPRRPSSSTNGSSARSRRPTSRPPRIISCSGRSAPRPQRACPYWIWLVLPRVFPDLLPAPGGYASLGFLAEGRPRDADRPFAGHRRISARRHQLRHVPRGQLPHPAGRAADDRRRGRVASDVAAAVLPVPLRRRRRSALQRRHAAGGDLTQHAAVAVRSPALSLRDHSRGTPRAAAAARLARQLDAHRGPTGAAAVSTPSIR